MGGGLQLRQRIDPEHLMDLADLGHSQTRRSPASRPGRVESAPAAPPACWPGRSPPARPRSGAWPDPRPWPRPGIRPPATAAGHPGSLLMARAAVRKARIRKWVFALQLQEGGDLLQHLGDRLLVHVVLYTLHGASELQPKVAGRPARGCASPGPAALRRPLIENRPAAAPPGERGREEGGAVGSLPDRRALGPLASTTLNPVALRMNAEHAQHSEHRGVRSRMDETAIQGLGRLPRDDFGPDAVLGHLGIVGRAAPRSRPRFAACAAGRARRSEGSSTCAAPASQ